MYPGHNCEATVAKVLGLSNVRLLKLLLVHWYASKQVRSQGLGVAGQVRTDVLDY